MSFSTSLIKLTNKIFKKPVHPFNLQNDGTKTYSEWQFEKGEQTLHFYLKRFSKENIIIGKNILDIGCGAAGKSLYYANEGAEFVTGIDVVARYEKDANALADKKGLSHKFRFVLGDAAALPFEDETFDTIIMNDAMEHVDNPSAVIGECLRVLKKGGRLFANFPPYNHPFGAHLSDAISMPWVHLFFSDKALIKAYKELAMEYPDGADRISFRISKDEKGREYFSYINKMTLRRFKKIAEPFSENIIYYNEEPLRDALAPFAKLPLLKELFVKMAVCVFEKY